MAKSNGKAIEKKQALPPAYLKQEDKTKMGTDKIDPNDIIKPRIKCVQPLTDEKFGAKDGELINNISGKNYGREMEVVPIVYFKSNCMFNKKLGLDCMSDDGIKNQDGDSCDECGKHRFSKDGEKPLCNEIHNFLIAERNELDQAIKNKGMIQPVVLSFMSAGTKTAKNMLTAIKLNETQQFPIYSAFFKIKVPDEPKEFDAGKAYMPDVKMGGWLSEDQYTYCKQLFDTFSGQTIKAKMDNDEVKQANKDEI